MSLSSFLHIVKWFKVLLYNSKNLKSVICLHKVCSIRLIDRTLSSATTPGQSGPRSNGNEGVLCILQISKYGASPLDGLMSYPGHSLEKGLTPLQRGSWCILQPKPTGLPLLVNYNKTTWNAVYTIQFVDWWIEKHRHWIGIGFDAMVTHSWQIYY